MIRSLKNSTHPSTRIPRVDLNVTNSTLANERDNTSHELVIGILSCGQEGPRSPQRLFPRRGQIWPQRSLLLFSRVSQNTGFVELGVTTLYLLSLLMMRCVTLDKTRFRAKRHALIGGRYEGTFGRAAAKTSSKLQQRTETAALARRFVDTGLLLLLLLLLQKR